MKLFGRQSVALCLLGLLSSGFVTVANAQSDRPNIIMMMADDMGWGDVTYSVRLGETAAGDEVNYSGTGLWDMPNLEAMAGNGLKFSRMYAQSPVCSPTRASVMTGRAPQRQGIDFAGVGNMENREVTLAEYAGSLGYKTGIFGKWHMGTFTRDFADGNNGGPGSFDQYSTPLNSGFETQYVTGSKVATYNPGLNSLPGGLTKPTYYWTGPGEFIDLNATELQGDDSLIVARETNAFIQDAVSTNPNQPFMAVSWFHTPHLPTQTPTGSQNNLTAYRFAMEGLDDAIGQIRDQVNSLGLENDTIIMFTSDNGAEDGHNYPANDGLRNNKRELHEGGIRVPGIIEWNGTVAPGDTHVPMVTTDYLPTMLDIWGIDAVDDRPLDGISMTEQIFGDRTVVREKSIITRSTNGHQAVIGEDGRYKLISTNNGSSWNLHDLLTDYDENDAVATSANIGSASPAVQSIYNELLGEFGQWTTSVANSLSGNISGDYDTRITSIAGATLSVEPPEDLAAGDVTNGDMPILFLERQHATLFDALDVNSLGVAGTYTSLDSATLDAGLVVNSFLLHFNPTDSSAVIADDVSITFDDPILGVIGEFSELESSDYLSFADPNFELTSGRRMDNADSWTISADGYTITFDIRATNFVDNARILTASSLMDIPLICDADADGDCDHADINILYDTLGSPGSLDLDGSGLVDGSDIALWLAAASDPVNPFKTSYPGGSTSHVYIMGDVNLDGQIDSTDLGLLLNNFSDTNGAYWGAGNLDGNQFVDSTDLGLLLNNFSFTSAAAVPEPNCLPLAWLVLLALIHRVRGNGDRTRS